MGAVAVVALAAALFWSLAGPADARGATCSDYENQAAAQRAADTRDADGDGIYCESLPCPCASPGSGGPPPPADQAPPPAPPVVTPPAPAAEPKAGCKRPRKVARIVFSRARYPNIRRHMIRAVARGWPKVMVVNRRGADARRDRLLRGRPTRRGFDRDEYPAAVGRGRPNGQSKGLVRGRNPRGWRADVAYVPSSENRSHGSSLGAKLGRYCNGTRFRYVFR